MSEAVRRADGGDLDALVELEVSARDSAAEQRGGPEHLAETPAADRDGWRARLATPAWNVWLATYDEVPFGYLSALLDDGVLRVEAVWVDPGVRELGLGDALLAAAIDSARSQGATTIEAVALPGDRATKNLYERARIKARALILSASLIDDEA